MPRKCSQTTSLILAIIHKSLNVFATKLLDILVRNLIACSHLAKMSMRTLSLSSSQNYYIPPSIVQSSANNALKGNGNSIKYGGIKAMAEKNDGQKEKPKEKSKQSLFTNLTDALDFSQVRSSQDAQLLEEAREATKTGGKMSREQVCSIDPTLIRYLDTC